MALTKLVQVLLRREAVGKALEAIERAQSPELDEPTRRAIGELHRYVELRGDLYERGSAALLKRVKIHDVPWSPPDERVRRRLQEGVDLLLRHQRANAASWQALWLAGKGLQALGDVEGAVREMARAFSMKPDQANVAREYVMTLLEVDRAADAEPVARAACNARPTEAGLVANLALVLLLAGKVDDAVETIERALEMDRNDKITAALAGRIGEVQRGLRPRSGDAEGLWSALDAALDAASRSGAPLRSQVSRLWPEPEPRPRPRGLVGCRTPMSE